MHMNGEAGIQLQVPCILHDKNDIYRGELSCTRSIAVTFRLMTVRNIASICNMVSGRRRLGGRAPGAARRRKGNPSRTPARRPVGVGAAGAARRRQKFPATGQGGPVAAPSPPPPSRPRDQGPRLPVPGPSRCASALGLRWKRLGGEAEPGRPGGPGWRRSWWGGGTHPVLATDKPCRTP